MENSNSTGTALLARSRAGTGLAMLKRRALLQAQAVLQLETGQEDPLKNRYVFRGSA